MNRSHSAFPCAIEFLALTLADTLSIIMFLCNHPMHWAEVSAPIYSFRIKLRASAGAVDIF
jgi:hypothetical protein